MPPVPGPISPALSAWEVCGAVALPPADSVTCGNLGGLSLSDRDHPRALLLSGTQRARLDPRIKRQTRPVFKVSGSVWAFGKEQACCVGTVPGRPIPSVRLAARVAALARSLVRPTALQRVVEYLRTHWSRKGSGGRTDVLLYSSRVGKSPPRTPTEPV
jgi:hypothetical protein